MRTITQEINIYNFKELTEEIKNKLIEEERQHQEENYCECYLLEDMQEKAKELLKKHFEDKATFKRVLYDLSYSQGSGAMIEFELYYHNKKVIIKNHGHYQHERSFYIDTYELTDKQEKQLKEKIIKINEELAEYGRNAIESYQNMPSDDLIEILKEHEYLENGIIYS